MGEVGARLDRKTRLAVGYGAPQLARTLISRVPHTLSSIFLTALPMASTYGPPRQRDSEALPLAQEESLSKAGRGSNKLTRNNRFGRRLANGCTRLSSELVAHARICSMNWLRPEATRKLSGSHLQLPRSALYWRSADGATIDPTTFGVRGCGS